MCRRVLPLENCMRGCRGAPLLSRRQRMPLGGIGGGGGASGEHPWGQQPRSRFGCAGGAAIATRTRSPREVEPWSPWNGVSPGSRVPRGRASRQCRVQGHRGVAHASASARANWARSRPTRPRPRTRRQGLPRQGQDSRGSTSGRRRRRRGDTRRHLAARGPRPSAESGE